MSSALPQPPSASARAPRRVQDVVDRARLDVVPRRRPETPRVPFLVLVGLSLLLGVVGLLLFNTSLQQASFATTALEKQAGTLSAREQSLRMDLDEQRNPQRVARRAQALGMVIPSVPTFLTLGGEVLGQRTPASEADRFPIEAPPVENPYAAPASATGPVAGTSGESSDTATPGRGTTVESQTSQEPQTSQQPQASRQSRR